MLYKTFLSAIAQVKDSFVANPNVDIAADPLVAIVMKGDDDTTFEVIGEIGAVMMLDDGRIGLVVSPK